MLTDVSRLAAFVKWCLSCAILEGLRGTNGVADSVSSAFIVEDLLRDQQLPRRRISARWPFTH